MDRDDLLQPTLAGHEERGDSKDQPWKLSSQVYVGFFGGALAVGAIGFYNSITLGMPIRARLAIAAIALAAEAALIAVVTATQTDEVRVMSVVAGLVAYGGAYLLQRSPDRVYHFHHEGDDDPYESLLGPGALACIVARLVEGAVILL